MTARMLVNGVAAAQVPALDRGLAYGDGLFESIRLVGMAAPLWARHMRRLLEGCTRLRIPAPDPAKRHDRFKQKHELGLTLLADESQVLANAYGIWVEKSMYGRKFMGIERSTFLIDTQGRIARIWRKVKVAGHAEEVLAAARAL